MTKNKPAQTPTLATRFVRGKRTPISVQKSIMNFTKELTPADRVKLLKKQPKTTVKKKKSLFEEVEMSASPLLSKRRVVFKNKVGTPTAAKVKKNIKIIEQKPAVVKKFVEYFEKMSRGDDDTDNLRSASAQRVPPKRVSSRIISVQHPVPGRCGVQPIDGGTFDLSLQAESSTPRGQQLGCEAAILDGF